MIGARHPLMSLATVAILAAVAVVFLKGVAWYLTGSVGLLSDALESLANVAGALMAYAMLFVAVQPPDEEHAYGHGKAEYFASGFEGALILAAAAGIMVTAAPRLLEPEPLAEVGPGLAVAAVAALLNLGVARMLLRAGAEHGSITLQATGQHLLTDVWTSVGVIGGVGAVALTGWDRLDAVVALAVAAHILVTGGRLVRRSALGLLDTALPDHEQSRIQEILDSYQPRGVRFHALRTRRAGRRSFVSVHVLVPGDWSVQRGHDLAEEIEARVQVAVPGSAVFTHLEPVEDPASFTDVELPEPPSPPRRR